MEGFITTIEGQSEPTVTQRDHAAARWYELGSSLSTAEAMRQRVVCREIPGWTLGLLWGTPRYRSAVTGEIATPDPEHVAAGRTLDEKVRANAERRREIMAAKNDDRPATYECTLCGKTHRAAANTRSFGTSKYDLHVDWRKPDGLNEGR